MESKLWEIVRDANPDLFDGSVERLTWRRFMAMLRLVTAESADAVEDATARLGEILA